MGLGGVTVRISGMADAETATDDNGGFSFRGLRAGTYSVEISGFDSDEVSFSSTSGAATVGVGETKTVTFDGTYVRTAAIMGRVRVEGEGLGGVTVTLMGEGAKATKVTDAGGLYAFSQLKSGDYQVAITNPEPDNYEFETTSKSITIATGEPATVDFDGTLLRTAGIAGRVSVEGMGLDGVTVTLAGAAEATTETANGGQYGFAGLAAGTYVLTITNPDEVAYNFADDELQKTVMLEDDQAPIVNFEGTHTRTASVSGMLFIDEVVQDKMHNDGEPSITAALAPFLATLDDEARMKLSGLLAKAKVMLRGPDLGDPPTMLDIDPLTGRFTTSASLMAGSYQVELPVNDEDVDAGLKTAGIAFVGESMVVTVEAGGSATVNFPFRITHQTISVEAVMGRMAEEDIPADRDRVEEVKLTLYANADESVMLGEPQMTDEDGMAMFHFARDANTGPGGNDNIVFVRAESPNDALVITDNGFIEVAYAGTDRVSSADAAVRLVNVAVNFDFWVKSTDDAPEERGGDTGLGGWAVEYCMPMADDPETDEKDAVVCTGDDAGFKAIMTGEGDDAEAVLSDDGEAKEANLGKVSFSHTSTAEMLAEGPVMFHVRAAEDQDGDKGEMWDQSDALTYEHTGLLLPPGKDDDPTDLGPIRIKFTTQSLTVGVYRETDDQPGFTDYRSDYPGGDHRPHTEGIEVELMYSEGGGRLKRYDYMTFDAKGKRTVEAANPMDVPKWNAKTEAGGTVTFKHLPADMDFTVRLRAGSSRTAVGDRDVDAYGDPLNDMSMGSFGAAGGAMPEVRLCPLTTTSRPDFLPDESDDCATFAYQWETGTVKATLTGLRKGVKATLTLDPVTDVHSEGDDEDFTGKTGDVNQSHDFEDVQDGVYRVVLTGGDVKEKKSSELVVYHNESASDPDDAPVTRELSVSATSVRGMIKGVVANNRIGVSDYTISSDEAGVGVELGLFEVKKTTGKPDAPGAAVTDDDGNAVTATTNEDGEYVFDNLVEGDEYFVKVLDCEGCVAYNSINADDHSFVANGKAKAKVYAASDKNMLPKWDHAAAAVGDIISNATDGGFLDFAMLYTDGTLSGEVSEPFDEVDNHDIELARCLTVNTAADACEEYDDTFEDEVETDDDGQWSVGGLREGAYEVTVNPKGGYRIYDSAKDVLQEGSTTDLVEYAAVKTDLFTLKEGSGASDEAPNVEIVNSRLSRTVTFGTIGITANGITYTRAADATAAVDVPASGGLDHIVPSITVAPVSPSGERFNVANAAAKTTVRPTAKDNGNAPKTKFTATLADGANAITVSVIAANGYSKDITKASDGTITVTAGSTTGVAVATVTRTAVQTAAALTSVTGDYTANNGAASTGNAVAVTAGTGGIDYVWGDGTNGGGGLPHDAQSKFSLTLTLSDGSAWATVGYRIGDSGDYTDIPIPADATTDAARAARKTGLITGPAKGASTDIQVKVVSQDGKTPTYYTIRVWREASP